MQGHTRSPLVLLDPKLRSPQAIAHEGHDEKQPLAPAARSSPSLSRTHGFTSLSLDGSGSRLLVACLDSKYASLAQTRGRVLSHRWTRCLLPGGGSLYVLDTMHLERGWIERFESRISSFCTKARFSASPSRPLIASGSSDGRVFLYEVCGQPAILCCA